MQLSLADGWTQVNPRDTSCTLLLSGQSPDQRLIAVDTAFTHRKDLAFSGGSNCPLAVDHANARVYFLADCLTSVCLRTGTLQTYDVDKNLGVFWMLEYRTDGPELVMLLHDTAPSAQCLGRLDLLTGELQRVLLPAEAFAPLAVNHEHRVALFSTRHAGAALCDLSGSGKALASIALPSFVQGGCFDRDSGRTVLGGKGLFGWNVRTGTISTLCHDGRYPKFDRQGDLWFCVEDGNLCRLRRDGRGFDVILELTGMDPRGWGYAQPIVFSPDGRYGVARLTGKTPLTGQDLAEAEEFCRRHGQTFSDFYRHRFHHFFCVLDLALQEVWCRDGYAHNLAWVEGDYVTDMFVAGG